MSSRKPSKLPSRTQESKTPSSKIPPPSFLFSRKKTTATRPEQRPPPPTSHFGFRSRTSSASSSDAPKRNVLRRKPSSNDQRGAYANQTSAGSTPSLAASPEPLSRNDTHEEFPLILGFSATPPPLSNSPARSFKRHEPPAIEGYGLPSHVSPNDFPAPAPPFHPGPSVSPSTTRYSESPSPWSRTSTPTSMSSHSPGVTMPSKFATKPRQQSPTRSRPPVTRRRAGSLNQDEPRAPIDLHGLPSLRESVTSSSSSGSTLRGMDRKEKDPKRKKSKHRMTSPPHSPPPRKSSQKFKKSQVIEATSLDREPTIPILPPPSRPQRPTRDRTPELGYRANPGLPVITSNLSGIQVPSGHKRNNSSSSQGAGSLGEGNGLRLMTSRLPSRNVSPSPTQLQPPPEMAPPSSLGRIPDLKNPEKSKKVAASPKSASPSRTPTSRFGFFSRRPKVVAEPEPPARAKKGPVAGTGHEGYGKYALRGRSGSQTSTGATRTRSTSTGTTESANPSVPKSRKGSITSKESDVDDFLRDRLDPVIIPGGGGSTAGSISGVDMSRSGSNQSSLVERPSLESKASSSQISVKSKKSNELARPTFFGFSRLSPSNASSRRPSTSSDREDTPTQKPSLAIRRSQNFSGKGGLTLPQPITIDGPLPSPSLGSRDTSIAPGTASSFSQTDLSEGKEGSWLRPKQAEKVGKSPRKWNFFQRTHNAITTKATPLVTEVSVTIARHQAPKSVAHYALMDSTDPGSSENLEDYFREARDRQLSPEPFDSPQEPESPMVFSRPPEAYSMLLPDPPTMPASLQNPRPASPKVMLRGTENRGETSSTEHLPTKPSRLPQVGRIPRVVSTKERNRHSKSAPPRAFPLVKNRHSRTESRQGSMEGSVDSLAAPTSRPIPKRSNTGDSSTGPFDPRSFLSFPPRKGSEISYSSSGGMSLSAAVAVNASPQVLTGEEEVWNEYDDLIDHMSPVPATLGSPFQYDQVHWGISPDGKPLVKESPVIGSDCDPSSALNPHAISPYRSSKFASTAMPATPLSLTDFLAGYGERNLSVRGSAVTRFSMSDVSRLSSASCYSRSQQEDDAPEPQPTAPQTQVNVRFGALMTSKWLSFGRVLFSPAHLEINAPPTTRQDRILILDGLGNDDWSFYCALTYPHATIYNLSPSPQSHSSSHSPPPNHRQIHHPDASAPFPFPRGFFTAAVYRFPLATTDSTHRLIISECKRVLRPGGYLELSVLDLDLMNMGPLTRRALMRLKLRMQAADPAVSLRSAADSLQRHLGRRGFENLNRCNVLVPAAGSLAGQSPVGSADAEAAGGVSLSALLSDESSEGDEGITNMVAKVGRWWYERCFEGGEREKSIWRERELLRECEAKKTSFKLLICYAQKPAVPKRRTVSV
ncbi:MAG: hypothetical protein M1814_006336 [Vezdaea aestivalis]|nr:MAG: hypothetical protein M1814_006336 [Vezdaea aestivalis]